MLIYIRKNQNSLGILDTREQHIMPENVLEKNGLNLELYAQPNY